MINYLRAKNFKSWADTGRLELAPLTGLFGTNSSGKTSILQLLLMLKQTVESSDRRRVLFTGDDRSLIDLGTFFDLIHGHQKNAQLDIELSWNLLKQLKIPDYEKKSTSLYETKKLDFRVSIKEESGSPITEIFSYAFDDKNFGMTRKNNHQGEYELISDGYKAKRIHGRVWPLPPPVKCYGFPDEVSGYYQNLGFLSSFVLEFEKLFSRIAYLGPLRESPKRSYLWAGDRPLDVGRKGEDAIPALLASRSKGKVISFGKRKRRQSVEERIGYWLREMGMIHAYSLKPIAENRKDYELRVQKTARSPEVLITDVGFGVSQILPVLVLCYYVPEGSVVIFEQPEIHLHPSVQACLADVFIEAINLRKIQIIVESHSEHLLRRLQRRIAEEKIPANKTALYFCSMAESSSRIEKLDVDSCGNIRNWPKDFFGDEMGDLVAMTDASMKRQAE